MLFEKLIVKGITAAPRNAKPLYGWGGDPADILGDGDLTLSNKSSPIQIGSRSWISISIGADHTLGIQSDSSLWGWGSSLYGQAGVNLGSFSSPVSIGTSWKVVDFGYGSSPWGLGIQSDGSLWGWGNNSGGQLGDGTTVSKSSPVKIGSSSWSAVSAGSSHSLGITTTGQLYAWGAGGTGLGILVGTGSTISSPVLVSGPVGTSWSKVAAGLSVSAAITTTGALYTWGDNTYGALGTTASVSFSVAANPIPISATDSWVAVSVGYDHSLGIKGDGTLWSWGGNSSGQLGMLSTISQQSPVLVSGPASTTWTKVAAGWSYSLAIDSNGRLWSWGSNFSGQLGINAPTTTTVSSPVLVSGPANTSWNLIVAGQYNQASALAITTTGLLYGWGLNNFGQVGNLTITNVSSPVLVSGPVATSWTAIASSGIHSVAISTTGALYTWGANLTGALGDGTTVSKSSPIQIGTSSWTAISAHSAELISVSYGGLTHAIDSLGRLFGWGYNTDGEIGNLSTTNTSSPVLVSGPAGVSWSFVAGVSTIFAITTTGLLYSWGQCNSSTQGGAPGQGGIGTGNISSPVLVSGPTGASWTLISVNTINPNPDAVMGITTTYKLYGWGNNVNGNAIPYNPLSAAVSSPVHVGSSSWSVVNMSKSTPVVVNAITSDGKLFAWGQPTNPIRLGTYSATGGTVAQSGIPILVSGPAATSWSAVSAGSGGNGAHTLAITSTGQLYAWGLGTSGELGNLGTVSILSPVLVSGPASTSWASISAGFSHSLATTTTGQLYAWGAGSLGQIGNLGTANASSPVLVSGPASTSWSFVAAGADAAIAATNASLAYGWGNNLTNIYIPYSTYLSTPVQIGTSSWTSVSAGASFSVGILANGSLYAWGLNAGYQLGNGTTTNSFSPTLITNYAYKNTYTYIDQSAGGGNAGYIDTQGRLWASGNSYAPGNLTTTAASFPTLVSGPAGASWSKVAAGASHMIAITTAGRLYTWGFNGYGQLGDLTLVNKSSPVLVSGPAGASWASVGAGDFNSYAITTTGRLYAWGRNNSGQLGDLTLVNKSSPVLVSGPAGASWSFVASGFGSSFAVAITTTGQLYAWGFGTSGQLGNLSTATTSSPVLVSGPASTSWVTATVGLSHALAITTTGQLYAWGLGIYGQLGDLTLVSKSSPVLVSGPAGASWASVAASYWCSFGITTTGVLYAWGQGNNGLMGDYTVVGKSSPIIVSGPAGASWSLVTASANNAEAITTNGLAYGWGFPNGVFYAIPFGVPNTATIVRPTLITTQSSTASVNWSAVSAGTSFTLALNSAGQLFAWGSSYPVLGDNFGIGRGIPSEIAGIETSYRAISIASPITPFGWFHATAISSTGRLYSWGWNGEGQVGVLSTATVYTPTLVSGPTNTSWTTVSAGMQYSLAITTTGQLYAWGAGWFGQLGNLGVVGTSSPVLVSGPAGASWSAIATGGSPTTTAAFAAQSLGITTTGKLYAWGYNNSGQLGNMSTATTSSPVLVSGPAGTSWSAVAAGMVTSMAITT